MAQVKLLHPGDLAFGVIPRRLKYGNRGTGTGIKAALSTGDGREGGDSEHDRAITCGQLAHKGCTEASLWGILSWMQKLKVSEAQKRQDPADPAPLV